MYKTLQISLIPVQLRDGKFFSDPLWTTDLNACAEQRGHIHLICPVAETDDKDLSLVDNRVNITSSTNLSDCDLKHLVQQSDVVEIPGNFGWIDSSIARHALKQARAYGKLCILGISSNRARTFIMNAAHGGAIAKVRARVKSLDIRLTQNFLARNCDGVRVTGEGLVSLIDNHAKRVFVETASWISKNDLETQRTRENNPPKVSLISRLEPMKGVEIGIRAVAEIIQSGVQVDLQIAGQGPDSGRLKNLVENLNISSSTTFLGQVSYPDKFFQLIFDSDFVALTNLNDEQPRLIFDAISRGAIPICPRTDVYSKIGLDQKLLYKQGSINELRDTLHKVIAMDNTSREAIRESLSRLAIEYTIETMHLKRDEWIQSLLPA